MQGYTPEHSDIYCPEFSYLFHTQRATLFIPETAVADVRAMFSRPTWSFRTLFSLKTYSGDVHSAQGRCDGSQTVLHKPRIHRQGSCGRQGFQVRHL